MENETKIKHPFAKIKLTELGFIDVNSEKMKLICENCQFHVKIPKKLLCEKCETEPKKTNSIDLDIMNLDDIMNLLDDVEVEKCDVCGQDLSLETKNCQKCKKLLHKNCFGPPPNDEYVNCLLCSIKEIVDERERTGEMNKTENEKYEQRVKHLKTRHSLREKLTDYINSKNASTRSDGGKRRSRQKSRKRKSRKRKSRKRKSKSRKRK